MKHSFGAMDEHSRDSSNTLGCNIHHRFILKPRDGGKISLQWRETIQR